MQIIFYILLTEIFILFVLELLYYLIVNQIFQRMKESDEPNFTYFKHPNLLEVYIYFASPYLPLDGLLAFHEERKKLFTFLTINKTKGQYQNEARLALRLRKIILVISALFIISMATTIFLSFKR